MPQSPPIVLSIAGSDCSAGAGAQADLKTFTALGCYGLTALTSVVAEVPAKVELIQNLNPEIIAAQIEVLAQSLPIGAIKTGMLGGRVQIEAVLCGLEHPNLEGVPLVVDPVMIATSGRRLLEEDAMELLITRLFPRAVLITPNLDEAAVLAGARPNTKEDMEQCGRALAAQYGCAVLIKGGHLSGDASDVLVEKDEATWLEGRRIDGVHTHGTGCTLSAAIAAGLAYRLPLREAVAQAKQFVAAAIAEHYRWGADAQTVDALNHQTPRGQDPLQPESSMLTSGLIL
jgi:hydroxymethylpyrimidine/phosphomethylpyrimidine kinase